MEQRSIVVGVNGTDAALVAVEWAILEGRRRQCPVRLLTVIEAGDGDRGVSQATGTDGDERSLRAVCEKVLTVAAFEAQVVSDIDVTCETLAGDPTSRLVEASRAARLLVLGRRIRRRWAGAPGWSVGAAVARRAACPVIVLPHDSASVDPSPVARAGPGRSR